MKRSTIGLVVTFTLGILVASLASDAQQPKQVPRIGVLDLGSQSSRYFAGLEAGELGYVEGQTIALEPRFAEGG